jgi:hypothetical protein
VGEGGSSDGKDWSEGEGAAECRARSRGCGARAERSVRLMFMKQIEPPSHRILRRMHTYARKRH